MDNLWQRIIKDKRILGGVVLLMILAAVPLTLNLASKEQDIRQRAATGTSCSINNPIDAMLIIDKSGSMGPPVNTDDRITPAKAAAKKFITILYQNGINQTTAKKNQTGVVSFAQLTNSTEGKTTLDAPLTLLSTQSNVTSVNTEIDAIKIFGRTCIQCGVRLANEEIKARGRTGVKKIVVLMTDGGANAYDGHLTADGATAEKAANDEVDKGRTESGITYFTIGLGNDVNKKFLENIATRTGGKYYFAPTAADLDLIYQQISTIVGKGSVSGTVYNDANGNKIQDTAETGQTGWKVTLLDSTNQSVIATTTSDDQGKYTFQGVCDGNYQVKLTIQSGWTLTIPPNDDFLSVSMTNGNALANQNFGVKQEIKRTAITCSPLDITLTASPQAISATLVDSTGAPISGKIITWTIIGGNAAELSSSTSTTSPTGVATVNVLTPTTNASFSGAFSATYAGDALNGSATCTTTAKFTPLTTSLTLSVLMHGIGNSGDNTNPDSFSLSNKSPLHINRNLTASIYDTNNKLVQAVTTQNLAYNPSLGNFSVTLNLGSEVTTGNYLIKIKSDLHLQRQYPGIIQVVANKNNTLPAIALVTGDVDQNNLLDIRDYNPIIDCYSDFEAPISCDAAKRETTDLNDDGAVNQLDYNLFLRDLAVQNGD